MKIIIDNIVIYAGFLVLFIEILGIIAAIHAVMYARYSQSAVAWCISLITFPVISLPLYLVFGRRKFHGYVSARRVGDLELEHITRNFKEKCHHDKKDVLQDESTSYLAFERLATIPFMGNNNAELLINGKATFDAIFQGIAEAKEYILFQFFIVKDDELGRKIKNHLIEKAKQGVRIYFLYDSIGSHALSKKYVNDLTDVGIQVHAFTGSGKKSNRLQINFRNHRKIVVIDGKTAYVGGHNVGVEYIGQHPVLSPWRDTHVKVEGPAVQGIQLPFIEDWYWASREIPELNWTPEYNPDRKMQTLVLPSGPADVLDTCGLFFVQAINTAKKRLWMTSPYFVPDEAVLSALKLAALRGVDVRIMLPDRPDHKLVYLASFSYIKEMTTAGIKMFRYKDGFLHQKVILIDDEMASVGSANIDNRSFRLNFEITLLFADKDFAGKVKEMLDHDFANCHEVHLSDIEKRSLPFRASARVARLFSPLL